MDKNFQVSYILPEIKLPMFDGSILNFPQFKNRFENLVFKFTSDEFVRYEYLRNCLTDNVVVCISEIYDQVKPFTVAWNILHERFYKIRVVKTVAINELLHYPKIHKQTLFSLRNFKNRIDKCLYSLKNLGSSVQEWDEILVVSLSMKLDQVSYDQFEDGLNNHKTIPTIQDLLNFLSRQINILEMLKIHESNNKNVICNNKKQTKIFGGVQKIKSCLFCNDSNHSIAKCKSFNDLSIKDRKKFILKKKYCLACLSHKFVKTKVCPKVNSRNNKNDHLLLRSSEKDFVPHLTVSKILSESDKSNNLKFDGKLSNDIPNEVLKIPGKVQKEKSCLSGNTVSPISKCRKPKIPLVKVKIIFKSDQKSSHPKFLENKNVSDRDIKKGLLSSCTDIEKANKITCSRNSKEDFILDDFLFLIEKIIKLRSNKIRFDRKLISEFSVNSLYSTHIKNIPS
jgi:hypothetical protein